MPSTKNNYLSNQETSSSYEASEITCSDLYSKFGLWLGSEKVIGRFISNIDDCASVHVTRDELGQACLNELLLCTSIPEQHGDLVSRILSLSSPFSMHDCLSEVVALQKFAQNNQLSFASMLNRAHCFSDQLL